MAGKACDALDREWREHQQTDDRRDDPTDDETGTALVGEREQHDPEGEYEHAGRSEPVRGLARRGRPDNAATTGTRAAARAGHHAAINDVTNASTRPSTTANHGSASGSMLWSTTDSIDR